MIEHLDGLGELADHGRGQLRGPRGDKFIGENTDGKGSVKSLTDVIDPAGKRVVMFGAGGAARAIGVELALPARRDHVVNRGRTVPVDSRSTARRRPSGLVAWIETHAGSTDIVVNATRSGSTRIRALLDRLRRSGRAVVGRRRSPSDA